MKAILERRSVRKFTDEPVSKEMLETLVECGRLTPTGHNKQGRSFLVATERSIIDEVITWNKF